MGSSIITIANRGRRVGVQRRGAARKRRKAPPRKLPPLTIEQILEWADDHHARTGRWPKAKSGRVFKESFQMWSAVDNALRIGARSLPGGTSLARLLHKYRGVPYYLPSTDLTIEQILEWADEYHRRSGRWPSDETRLIPGVPHQTWLAVDRALRRGGRGLPGGSSLARLLAEFRGIRNRRAPPELTIEQILEWADDHQRRTGRWPTSTSGTIAATVDEKWMAIHAALRRGSRGLSGGSSLARLLAEHRGMRNPKGLAPLSIPQILLWADAHRRRTGRWPRPTSGPVHDAPGETWHAINRALYKGSRGLPPGSSLNALLIRFRGVPKRVFLPRLTLQKVLAWAESYRRRTGRWPNVNSCVIGVRGAKWRAIDRALHQGLCGLPGGTTLRQLLAEQPRMGTRGTSSVPSTQPRQRDGRRPSVQTRKRGGAR